MPTELESFKVVCCPLNAIIGDFEGIATDIIAAVAAARARGADLVLFPELCACGYPPRDLLYRVDFLKKQDEVIAKIVASTPADIGIVIGAIRRDERGDYYNVALFISAGATLFETKKCILANSDVFFEPRYFTPGPLPTTFMWRGVKLGIIICEDAWHEETLTETPAKVLAADGAQLILDINASPFIKGKQLKRREIAARIAGYGVPFIYVNSLGGQSDLIFDGGSHMALPCGVIVEQERFSSDPGEFFPFAKVKAGFLCDKTTQEETFAAVTLGLRDYVVKSGFSRVHLGLSGGVDSALAAAIAVEALGADNVFGILMPSPYSSEGSVSDALALANNLGIQTATLSIEEPLKVLKKTLSTIMRVEGLTEENLQARIRGNYLMAYGNSVGSMLLTTGNKSELATGYGTLYGDMCGAYNPIGDLFKTEVYALCAYINECKEPNYIPKAILTKAPSAELRLDQRDCDSLPDYAVLDAILRELIEEDASREALMERYPHAAVERTLRLVAVNEFKRFQAPPVAKVSKRAFGSGRLIPLARHFFEL